VHPALHEGFGLTLAEAMRAGARVLAGRAPGVVETAGDAALYADPRDPEDLARALSRLAGDADLRAQLAARGRQRADRLTWEGSARAHIRAYTLALG
jgi:glycosyltransferase involved in cell wall biosynthesis